MISASFPNLLGLPQPSRSLQSRVSGGAASSHTYDITRIAACRGGEDGLASACFLSARPPTQPAAAVETSSCAVKSQRHCYSRRCCRGRSRALKVSHHALIIEEDSARREFRFAVKFCTPETMPSPTLHSQHRGSPLAGHGTAWHNSWQLHKKEERQCWMGVSLRVSFTSRAAPQRLDQCRHSAPQFRVRMVGTTEACAYQRRA